MTIKVYMYKQNNYNTLSDLHDNDEYGQETFQRTRKRHLHDARHHTPRVLCKTQQTQSPQRVLQRPLTRDSQQDLSRAKHQHLRVLRHRRQHRVHHIIDNPIELNKPVRTSKFKPTSTLLTRINNTDSTNATSINDSTNQRSVNIRHYSRSLDQSPTKSPGSNHSPIQSG